MLGKLFAHEWKDTWKLMAILNGAVLVLSVIGMGFAAMGNLSDIFDRSDAGNLWVFMMYFSFVMLYVLGIAALSIGTILYFYIRFYRNMYTDQGYLMHTLPVTEHELILSKLLVAFIWRIIGTIVMAIGIGAIAVTFMTSTGDFFEEIIPSFRDTYREFMNMMYDGKTAYFIVYLIVTLITGIGSVIYSIFMGYAAISLGQLAKKNRVLASVGIFFGMLMVTSMISNFISQFFMLFSMRTGSLVTDDFGKVGAVTIGSGVLTGILVYGAAAVFYFITWHTMKDRLNLE